MNAVLYLLIVGFGDANLVSFAALEEIKRIVNEKMPASIVQEWSKKKYIVGYNKRKAEYGIILCGTV